jgi:hypothetical protein
MDTTVIISDYLDNTNIDNFEAFFLMADDYKYELLAKELCADSNSSREEINIDNYPDIDLPF